MHVVQATSRAPDDAGMALARYRVMRFFKASLLALFCIAACRNTPGTGSRDGSGNKVDGTGHTGAVVPANGTMGDPAAPAGAPAGGSSMTANPAPAGSAAGGANAPSGTGNSNTDLATGANGGDPRDPRSAMDAGVDAR